MRHEKHETLPTMLELSPTALNLTQEEWTLLERLAAAENLSKEEFVSRALKLFLNTPPIRSTKVKRLHFSDFIDPAARH